MLPKKLRAKLFEKMSIKTMRYVSSIPKKEAEGLVARTYAMIAEDFFINGSLTSHSKVPELLAGVWMGGRESILVSDRLDRTTKEAMTAVLSQTNDCVYCGDMLVSLVYGGGRNDVAFNVSNVNDEEIGDGTMRERLAWTRKAGTAGPEGIPEPPFTPEELPEAIGALFAMSHINRFSHVVMDGSPVTAPFGFEKVKSAALRMFGSELKETTELPIKPGRSLELLPPAPLPMDMEWARPNPRIADALSRWAGAIERESLLVVSDDLRKFVEGSLKYWHGEPMPISRSWVEKETEKLTGQDRSIARLALVVAKAPYQVDEKLVEEVMGENQDERKLIRVLAWASFSAARRFAQRIAKSACVNDESSLVIAN